MADPFEFVEEEYQPNPQTVDFSESFLELFGSDSESEFSGFTREDTYLPPGSRVCAFHTQQDQRVVPDEDDKENSHSGRGRKRKKDPSRKESCLFSLSRISRTISSEKFS